MIDFKQALKDTVARASSSRDSFYASSQNLGNVPMQNNIFEQLNAQLKTVFGEEADMQRLFDDQAKQVEQSRDSNLNNPLSTGNDTNTTAASGFEGNSYSPFTY